MMKMCSIPRKPTLPPDKAPTDAAPAPAAGPDVALEPALPVWINGQLIPADQASLSVHDRGALFADGVYEVVRCYDGKPYLLHEHQARLGRSLGAIELACLDAGERLARATEALRDASGLLDARLYWQVTRGAEPRRHAWSEDLAPNLLATIAPDAPLSAHADVACVAAVCAPDLRWKRCDIKSLMLMPNVLAKQRAARLGADEAILLRTDDVALAPAEGWFEPDPAAIVTEGASTNVLLVRQGAIRTHPLAPAILAGVTRARVLALAQAAGMEVIQTPFTLADLRDADEIMLTSTTSHIKAVTRLNGRTVGRGEAGPVATRLNAMLTADIAAHIARG